MSDQLIRHMRQFTALSPEAVPLIREQLQYISLKKKELLLKEGQYCNNWYFVEKGCLRLFFVNDRGAEQTTQFAIENWWLSDYMSFDRQQPAGFFIQAVEASEVVILDRDAQDLLCAQIPAIERYFRLILQRAYAATQLRFRYLYDHSREELYYQFSRLFPEFIQRIPQYMLASYLGFTPEYLSELRKKEASRKIS